jgi:hypothetical protein
MKVRNKRERQPTKSSINILKNVESALKEPPLSVFMIERRLRAKTKLLRTISTKKRNNIEHFEDM